MRPPETRWARIGPKNPATLFHTPEAGICLSAFVVAHRGRTVLLGRPRAGPAWPQKGGYPEAQARELEEEGAWLLPATHLLIEESPDHAALRIARDFAGLPGIPRFVMVQSHLRPARLWNPKWKGNHWDICFVYDLAIRGLPKPMPWWAEFRFVAPDALRSLKVGRGHRDILEEAGYLRRPRSH